MEPLFHYIIPLLGIFAIFPKFSKRFGYKKLLLLGLLSFIPDLDLFIGMHRVLFHNLLFVTILSLIILFIFGKTYGLLSIYFLGSHLLFDLNRFGAALLWPFYKNLMGFEIGLMFHKVNGFKLIIDFFIEPILVVKEAMVSWYLHPMGTLVLILILLLVLIKILKKKFNIILF